MRHSLTMSDLRRITGRTTRTINHAIERYGPEPSGRIGIARVWDRSAIPEIREALRKTTANRTRSAKDTKGEAAT